jgi:hypothetical protein
LKLKHHHQKRGKMPISIKPSRFLPLLACLLVLVITGCQPQETIAPESTVTASAALPSPTNSPEPQPTQTKAITPTPTSTPDPILTAAEDISLFSVYDDFLGPFDAGKWSIEHYQIHPFTYTAEEGVFSVDIDPGLYGPETGIDFNIQSEALAQGMNGLSVSILPAEAAGGEVVYGPKIILTDGHTRWSYHCDIFNNGRDVRLDFNLDNLSTGAQEYHLGTVMLFPYQEYKIQMEWIPESGLLLTFLNGQLLDSFTLDGEAPIEMENAGINVYRISAYGRGTFKFSDFRLGTYHATSLDLPDDLIVQREAPLVQTTNAIDYYLYDDFQHPLFDNFMDLHHWEVYATLPEKTDENEEDEEHSESNPHFGQQQGQFIAEGPIDMSMAPIQGQEGLRAIQVNVVPEDGQIEDGILIFQLGVRTAQTSIMDDSGLLFEYFCSLNFHEGQNDDLACHYLIGNEPVYLSESIPVRDNETITFRLAYDELKERFQASINDIVVDAVPVAEGESQQIQTYGLTPLVIIYTGEGEQLVLDDFAVGLKNENPTPEPTPTAAPVEGILPHSDLYLYDDFENDVFDMTWNPGLWSGIKSENNRGFYQQDGDLKIGVIPEDAQGLMKIYTNPYRNPSLDQANAIQIEIDAVEENVPGIVGMEAIIAGVGENLGRNGNEFSCNLSYVKDRAFLICQAFLGGEEPSFSSGTLRIDPTDGHLLAVEFDRSSHIFYVYLDGVFVLPYQAPATAFDSYIFDLQSQAETDSSDVVRVENVWIGQPADHPEAMQNPETPFEIFDPFTTEPDRTIVETTPYTQFFSPYNVNLGFGHDDDGWWVSEALEKRTDNLLIVSKEQEDWVMLWPKVADVAPIDEVNAAAVTFSPVDDPPKGWEIHLNFINSGGPYELQAMVTFQPDGTTAFYYHQSGYENVAEDYYSPEILIDPSLPHRVSIEVDPQTYLIYISLDGEYVFEVDSHRPSSFFALKRFNFSLDICPTDSPGEDFTLRLDEFLVGTPE